MALRDVLADLRVRVTGVDRLRRTNVQVDQAVAGFRSATRVIGGFAVALQSAFAVREIVEFTGDLIRTGDELDKTSQQLGLSVEALQRWRFVAERSGVSTEQLNVAVRTLTRNAGFAAHGTGEAVRAFQTLGISLRDSGGNVLESNALLEESVRALASVENSTERAALASRLFGESGAQLLPIINAGEDGIARLNAQFVALGGGMSQEATEAAAEAADAIANFEVATTSLKGQLAASFLPTLTRVIQGVVDIAQRANAALRRSSALQVAFAALKVTAGALAIVLGVAAAAVVTLLAPFILLFLAVEDVVTMFRCGQSLIGDFIDELFGVGTAQEVVDNLTQAW